MRFAERTHRLGTESAFEVANKARALEAQGRHIIHLEFGEPDFPTPPNIVEAGIRALRNGKTKYTASQGILELREAIVEHTYRTRGVSITPNNVVVTPGAKPIMFFTILALVDSGDQVLYPNPGFPIYESMINYAGGKAIPYTLREANQFRFDPDEFRTKVNRHTKLIILNSPENPTGGVLEQSDLEMVAELALKYDCTIFSDEIYGHLVYDGTFHSFLNIPTIADRLVILDGFSKTYAMTGWRLGWGIMPADLAEKMTLMQINSTSCVADFVQHAGIEALRGPQDSVQQMVAAFKARRDAIVEGMNTIPGFKCLKPQGAFYAFPNITGTGWNSRKLADYILNEAGVACLSGTAFGAAGEGYLRFSYANSLENIQQAIAQIRQAVTKIHD